MARSKLNRITNIIVALISSVFFILYLYLFVFGVIVEVYKREYLYMDIYSPLLLIVTIVFSVVLPALLCFLSWRSLSFKKLWMRIVGCALSFSLLVIWIVPNIILIGFGGGLASHTDSLDNYCRFDSSVNNIMNKCDSECILPDKELLSDNCRYCYYYNYGMFDEIYSVQLENHLPSQSDFVAEKNRMIDIGAESFSSSTYYFISQTMGESKNNELSECCTSVACFDDSKQNVVYYVFRSENKESALERVSQIDKQQFSEWIYD